MAAVLLVVAANAGWFGGVTAATATTAASVSAGTVFAAGAVGAFVDMKFLFPALFPASKVEQKLDDNRISTGSEGSPKNFCMGPQNRTGTTLIWSTDLQLTKLEASTGKGGASGEFIENQYTVDCAYYVCDGPIRKIPNIIANGQPLYAEHDSIAVGNVDVIGTYEASTILQVDPFGTNTKWTKIIVRFVTVDNVIGTGLENIQSGQKATITGLLVHPEVNGEWEVVATEVWKYADPLLDGRVVFRVLIYEGDATGAPSLGSLFNDTCNVFQSNPVFNSKIAEEIVVYRGTEDQLPDPLMESYMGVGEVPAYRGSCLIRFKKLNLTNFANIPPTLECEVKADGTQFTVAKAITKLCTKFGSAPKSAIDVSLLPDELFLGMTVSGVQSIPTALGNILTAYNIMVRVEEGKFVFFKRTDPPTKTIDTEKLGASSSGRLNKTLRLNHEAERKLPTVALVSFIDPEKMLQTGNRRARMSSKVSDRVESANFPMTLTGEFASQLAYRILFDAWASNERGTTFLPPSEADLAAGTLITTTSKGKEYDLSIENCEVGADYTVEAQVRIEDLDVLDQSAIVIDDEPIEALVKTDNNNPVSLAWTFLDVPGLSDQQAISLGVNIAVAPFDSTRTFRGCEIYESSDNQRSFHPIGRVERPAIMGHVIAVENFGGTHLGIDSTSYIEVRMLNNAELESVEPETSLAGANIAYCHGEVLSFIDADLTANGTYKITNMRHGLRGTENQIGQIEVGDLFVIVSKRSINFVPLNAAALKTPRYYKVVAAGASPELVTAVPYTFFGASIMPMSPYNVKGSRNSSDDLTITWMPRQREIMRLGQTGRSVVEEEKYFIDIYDGDEIVRSIKTRAIRSFIYTAANQTADGLTPGDPVEGTISAIEAVVGRGIPRRFIV